MRKPLLTCLSVFMLFLLCTTSGCSKEADTNTNAQPDFIKLGNLEIRTTDFAQMTPEEGETICRNLGQGWRLPTVEEMTWIAQNQQQVPNIVKGGRYWTSSVTSGQRYSVYTLSAQTNTYSTFLESDQTKRMYIRAVR